MADFTTVLRRAVANLDDNRRETRAALYGKARAALERQLRSLEPPLSAEEIDAQIAELDEAISGIEADYAASPAPPPASHPRQPEAQRSEASETASPESPEFVPPPPPASFGAGEEAPGGAREEPGRGTEPYPAVPSGSISPAHGSFRSTVAETAALGTASASAARSAREALEQIDRDSGSARDTADGSDRPASDGTGGQAPAAAEDEAAQWRDDSGPVQTYDDGAGDGVVRVIVWAIVVLVLAGLAGVGYWQRDAVTQAMSTMFAGREEPRPDTGEVKIDERVPTPGAAEPEVSETPPPAVSESGEAPQPVPESFAGGRVSQALLVEEVDRDAGTTAQAPGTVEWALVEDPEVNGGSERVIRATVRVPENDMAVALAIRRNMDRNLPASHTVEILFDLPADFEKGSVEAVPGLVLKASPQSSGQPLVGAVVRVTDNFFLIGLSQSTMDRQRNLEELRRRNFIDIPLAYADGSRALLSIAKGESGNEVFAQAFEAWGR